MSCGPNDAEITWRHKLTVVGSSELVFDISHLQIGCLLQVKIVTNKQLLKESLISICRAPAGQRARTAPSVTVPSGRRVAPGSCLPPGHQEQLLWPGRRVPGSVCTWRPSGPVPGAGLSRTHLKNLLQISSREKGTRVLRCKPSECSPKARCAPIWRLVYLAVISAGPSLALVLSKVF